MKKYLKAKDANGFFPVTIIAEQILDPQYTVETKDGKRALTAEERIIILIEEALCQFGKKLTPEDVCRSLNMDFLTAETILDNMVELGIFEYSKGVKR